MCSYMQMFTVRHILIAWRMLRKGCYGNSNVLAFSIVGQTKTIQWFQCHAWMRCFLFLKMEEKKIPVFQNIRILVYVWTASLLFVQGLHCDYWNGVHLEEDYPITTVFENNRFSSFFCKRTNNIQENEGCFLRGQVCMVEPWILLLRLQKNLENLWFSKNIVIG